MSGHALMGCPDTRLELMALVFSSYIVNVLFEKGDEFPCMGAIY